MAKIYVFERNNNATSGSIVVKIVKKQLTRRWSVYVDSLCEWKWLGRSEKKKRERDH